MRGRVPNCAAREIIIVPTSQLAIRPFFVISQSLEWMKPSAFLAKITMAVVAAKDSWKLTLNKSSGRRTRIRNAAAAMVLREKGCRYAIRPISAIVTIRTARTTEGVSPVSQA